MHFELIRWFEVKQSWTFSNNILQQIIARCNNPEKLLRLFDLVLWARTKYTYNTWKNRRSLLPYFKSKKNLQLFTKEILWYGKCYWAVHAIAVIALSNYKKEHSYLLVWNKKKWPNIECSMDFSWRFVVLTEKQHETREDLFWVTYSYQRQRYVASCNWTVLDCSVK